MQASELSNAGNKLAQQTIAAGPTVCLHGPSTVGLC